MLRSYIGIPRPVQEEFIYFIFRDIIDNQALQDLLRLWAPSHSLDNHCYYRRPVYKRYPSIIRHRIHVAVQTNFEPETLSVPTPPSSRVHTNSNTTQNSMSTVLYNMLCMRMSKDCAGIESDRIGTRKLEWVRGVKGESKETRQN